MRCDGWLLRFSGGGSKRAKGWRRVTDDETPARLEKEGLASPQTRFTYAIGRLVLWSTQPGRVDAQGAVLRRGDFARLAIANPKVAPYGAAAVEVMERLGVRAALAPKIVQGDSITQAGHSMAWENPSALARTLADFYAGIDAEA